MTIPRPIDPAASVRAARNVLSFGPYDAQKAEKARRHLRIALDEIAYLTGERDALKQRLEEAGADGEA